MQTPENLSQIAAPAPDAARENSQDAATPNIEQSESAPVVTPLSAAPTAASTREPDNDPAPVTFQTVTVYETAPESAAPVANFVPTTTAPANDAASQAAATSAEDAAQNTSIPTNVATPEIAVSQAAAENPATHIATAQSAALENGAPQNSATIEVREPPRALFPGSFLGGEYEIKTVLSRGLTNIYEAQGGEYGNTTPCLIAEREIVAPAVASPQNAPTEIDASTRATAETASTTATSSSATSGGSASADEAARSGAFVEDVDTLPNSPLPPAPTATAPQSIVSQSAASTRASAESANSQQESGLAANGLDVKSAAAPPATIDELQLEAALFSTRKHFAQDDREYLVFEHFASQALQDHREATNDERALSMLISLSQGLCELEAKNLHAVFSTDTLRVDENGDLRFLGFVGPASGGETTSYIKQMRDCASFILKRVFAESSTMSLEDEYGALAFSVELKEVARKISRSEYSRVSDVAADLEALLPRNGKLHVDAALLSDVGQERELNEDAGFITRYQRAAHLGVRDYDLYVVADGMGGHEGGEVASDLTLSALQNRLDEYSRELNFDDNVAVRAMLIQVIDSVNADVVALTETPRYRGTRAKPGATLCFALRLGARVFFGNVGDSRAYKFTPEHGLERVSKDHSYVQTLIDRGEITEEEAFVHPDGSIITAHIGYPKLKTRDVFLRLVSPGDKILIVSDGVTDMLRDAAIAPHLQQNDSTKICRTLVDASNAAGGLDNITALCVIFS